MILGLIILLNVIGWFFANIIFIILQGIVKLLYDLVMMGIEKLKEKL